MPEYHYKLDVNADGNLVFRHAEQPRPKKRVSKPKEPTKVPLAEFDLQRAWTSYSERYGYWDHTGFRTHVSTLVSDPTATTAIAHCCDCIKPGIDHTWTQSGWTCGECLSAYSTCVRCDALVRYATEVAPDGEEVCRGCRDRLYTYCDPCAYWYENDDENEVHNHGGMNCRCESPPQARHFTVRNDGNPPLGNDTLVTVTLPSGVISEVGMEEIAYTLRTWGRSQTPRDDYDQRAKWSYMTANLAEKVGDKWQAKQGNFTKRLSRYAYKEYGLKIEPVILSQIGNIANAHSAGAEYRVAFTRDLNMSPEEYANYDSCWWGSYASSRCALKSNGGFALRSFFGGGGVAGRAWVMPLRVVGERPTSATLAPTFESLNPDAFIVFNGYGEMQGYIPARILSHLAGMTYRKVGFIANPIYINNESGYLVAPEEIADHYTDGDLELSIEVHATLFEREMKEISHVA